MENASKALIIAGAILLSILIIGLGMAVYNNASSSVGTANLDAQEIAAHNSQFLAYEGKQKGSQVKSLMNLIKNNNKEFADRQVKIYYSTNTSENAFFSSHNASISDNGADINYGSFYNDTNNSIKSKATYFVTFKTGANGAIQAVDVHVYSQDA